MIFSHSDPALIESAPVDQVVLEKDNVTLHCNATGNPTPNITWTKDNSSSVLHQGDIYSIVNITRDAAGNYTCTAWNGVGEQKKAIAEVTVHCELIFFLCSDFCMLCQMMTVAYYFQLNLVWYFLFLVHCCNYVSVVV